METIQYILSKIKFLIILIIVLLFLFWLGRVIKPLLPQEWFSFGNKVSIKNASSTEFFLPTPSNGIQSKIKPTMASDYIYVSDSGEGTGFTFNGYDTGNPQGMWQQSGQNQYTYVRYTTNQAQQNTGNQVFDANKAGFSQSSAFLRGVTIPVGAYVYRGLIFHGQAREVMFVNGKFSLFVIDSKGNVIGQGEAVTDEDYRVAGWHMFSARIVTIAPPSVTGCGLVFQQDKPQGLHAVMPVQCH
mgnify:CR=1 FL=1